MSRQLLTYGDPPPAAAVMVSPPLQSKRFLDTEIQKTVFLYFTPAYPGGVFTPRLVTTPDKIRGYFCACRKYFYVMCIMWITWI